MFTTNTRKYVVMGSCAGMIILDVVLMVASNSDKMENGYSNLDSKLDLKDIDMIPLIRITILRIFCFFEQKGFNMEIGEWR